MDLPEQHTRIVASDPIVVGDLRLLPSVLVNSRSRQWPGRGLFKSVRMRPVSVVVESPDGARWHEIPNAESDAISSMMAVAGGIAAVSIVLVVIARLIKRS